MTAVLLALLSAAAYGVGDFLSGAASRVLHFVRIALVTQLVMAAVTWAVIAVSPSGFTESGALWGFIAGIGSSLGTVFLYRGLGRGRMNVVAPLSAATAAIVPVTAGLLLGERPSWVVLVGVLLILPAIWLISAGSAPGPGQANGSDGAVDAVLAGAAFALSYIALDRAPAEGGLWPAGLTQLSGVLVVAIAALLLRPRGGVGVPSGADPDSRERGRALAAAGASGVLGAIAVGSFLLATEAGMLVVVSVLTSLYPAVTVLLAAGLLGERASRSQLVGLMLGATGVVLVVIG